MLFQKCRSQLVFKTGLTGIISESLVRPVRRRSTLPALDYNAASASKNSNFNAAAAVSKSSSTPMMSLEKGEREESSSDYCSQGSDVATSRGHRRKCSITVSVNGDFFSCLSDKEEEDGEGGKEVKGKGGKVPSYLQSLWREMDLIMKDIERARRQEALENQLSSSWSRFMWLVRRYSPSGIPLVGSLVGGHGNDPADPNSKSDDFEDNW